MPSLNVTDVAGTTREIQYETGLSLMEILRDEGYEEIMAMCGGCCSCATCHVHIASDQHDRLPVIEEDEEMLIELADNYDPAQSRLSCQIELSDELDGLKVQIIETA
ncbi:MAG: 2Fe-2S iron-sulfur cluster-binding protein [Pseudomonadota bacterium]